MPPTPAEPASDWKIAAASFAVAWTVRFLGATVRTRHVGDELQRRWEGEGEHFILAFWHRHLLMMPKLYRGSAITIMISQHRDGEIAARAVGRLGIESTRGSTTRGAVGALKALLKKAKAGYDLGFATDGPKGPPEVVKAGVVMAARTTGLPVLPVAFAASRQKVLGTWDRMVVPWPGSKVWYVHGDPIHIDRNGDPEAERLRLEAALKTTARRAEELAGGTPRGETP